MMQRLICLVLFLQVFFPGLLHAADVQHEANEAQSLTADQLGVVINEADANSIEVGEYYVQARNNHEKNVIRVNIPGKPHTISVEQFAALKAAVEGFGPAIQAIVLVWTAPYAVECNSITSALTMGYDAAQCRKTCAAGRQNPSFNSASHIGSAPRRERVCKNV